MNRAAAARPHCSPLAGAQPPPVQLDPFEQLDQRSRRLANVVEATSRRSDVRRVRSQILLMLLDLRCPPTCAPRVSWYVPGAVARLGAEGLKRAWRERWGEEPRSIRALRSHLGVLQNALALVKAPGDWIPMLRNPQHPEHRPRYADTFHLVESEQAARWWSTTGRELLDANPRARTNPDVWDRVFGRWRQDAAKGRQLEIGDLIELDAARRRPDRVDEPREPMLALEEVLARRGNAFEVLAALRDVGCRPKGVQAFRIANNHARLRGAAALFALAHRRGDRFRNRAGWVVRAFQASPAEHAEALEILDALGGNHGTANQRSRGESAADPP